MNHLSQSIERVLATRTNAYLVAIAALVATSAPIFNKGKESPAGYLSAPMVFALVRPMAARKGQPGENPNPVAEKKATGFTPTMLQMPVPLSP